jgi:MFS family permease
MILGVGLQALTVAWAGLRAHAWQFLPAGLIFGLGGGLAIVPIFSIILAGVADHEVGSASGVLNALQQLGGTIGVAVTGTLFFELLPDGDQSGPWRSPRSLRPASWSAPWCSYGCCPSGRDWIRRTELTLATTVGRIAVRPGRPGRLCPAVRKPD